MKRFTIFSVVTALSIQTASAQWVQIDSPEGGNIEFLGVVGDNVLAGVGGGAVFISTDNGAQWNLADSSIRTAGLNSIARMGATAFAGTKKGVFVSVDNGVRWSAAAGAGLPATGVNAVATIGSRLFAGTDRGAFVSTDNGALWTKINTGLGDTCVVTAFGVIGSRLFAGTTHGVFLTVDNGEIWSSTDAGLTPLLIGDEGSRPSAVDVIVIATIDSTLFIGDWECGAFFSSDYGTTWKKARFNTFSSLSCLAAGRDVIFGGGHEGGLYRATDFGHAWTKTDSGIYTTDIHAIAVNDTTIFAGTGGSGVYVSTNNGANWQPANSGLMKISVTHLAWNISQTFAGTSMGLFSSVLSSDIHQNNWYAMTSGPRNKSISALSASWGSLYVGCYSEAFLSTSNGAGWTTLDSGLNYPSKNSIHTLAANGATIFAGAYEGVFVAAKKDGIWKRNSDTSGLPYAWQCHVESFAVNNDTVFAGISDIGVFRSIDNGTSWKSCGLTGISTKALTINNGRLFAATDSGLFTSNNYGAGWNKVTIGSGNRRFLSLTTSRNNVIAGTESGNGGIFMSTDNGDSWMNAASGLPDGNVAALIVNNDIVFAGIERPEYLDTQDSAGTFFGRGVWQRPLAEMTVGVALQPKSVPDGRIHFNVSAPPAMRPTTTISFTLPCRERVTVSVHDLSGRAIVTLVNNAFGPGTHQCVWNAATAAPGCYFIRMRAGSQLQVKQVSVVR